MSRWQKESSQQHIVHLEQEKGFSKLDCWGRRSFCVGLLPVSSLMDLKYVLAANYPVSPPSPPQNVLIYLLVYLVFN